LSFDIEGKFYPTTKMFGFQRKMFCKYGVVRVWIDSRFFVIIFFCSYDAVTFLGGA
jgi:hypothetical protein